MEVTGIVHKIFEVQTLKKDFKKQEVIIKTFRNSSDQYPQFVPIEFLKDNIDHLHGLVCGDEITVHINIKGREYNDKFYCSIEGWRVVRKDVKTTEKSSDSEPIVATNDLLDEEGSGLPF